MQNPYKKRHKRNKKKKHKSTRSQRAVLKYVNAQTRQDRIRYFMEESERLSELGHELHEKHIVFIMRGILLVPIFALGWLNIAFVANCLPRAYQYPAVGSLWALFISLLVYRHLMRTKKDNWYEAQKERIHDEHMKLIEIL